MKANHFLLFDQLQSSVDPTQFYRENADVAHVRWKLTSNTVKWREIYLVHIWRNSARAGIKGERLCIYSVVRVHLDI